MTLKTATQLFSKLGTTFLRNAVQATDGTTGQIISSIVSTTALGNLDDVTSNVQTQLDGKNPKLRDRVTVRTVNGESVQGAGNMAVDYGNSIPMGTILYAWRDSLPRPTWERCGEVLDSTRYPELAAYYATVVNDVQKVGESGYVNQYGIPGAFRRFVFADDSLHGLAYDNEQDFNRDSPLVLYETGDGGVTWSSVYKEIVGNATTTRVVYATYVNGMYLFVTDVGTCYSSFDLGDTWSEGQRLPDNRTDLALWEFSTLQDGATYAINKVDYNTVVSPVTILWRTYDGSSWDALPATPYVEPGAAESPLTYIGRIFGLGMANGIYFAPFYQPDNGIKGKNQGIIYTSDFETWHMAQFIYGSPDPSPDLTTSDYPTSNTWAHNGSYLFYQFDSNPADGNRLANVFKSTNGILWTQAGTVVNNGFNEMYTQGSTVIIHTAQNGEAPTTIHVSGDNGTSWNTFNTLTRETKFGHGYNAFTKKIHQSFVDGGRYKHEIGELVQTVSPSFTVPAQWSKGELRAFIKTRNT